MASQAEVSLVDNLFVPADSLAEPDSHTNSGRESGDESVMIIGPGI